jgi:hypothetical protein
MSKKEPKDPVKWNGFNYMELKDYVGPEVRLHPFLYGDKIDLDKVVIEGFIVELHNIITKTVTQDNGEAISPPTELELKKVTVSKKKGVNRRVEIEFALPVQSYKQHTVEEEALDDDDGDPCSI